MNSPSDPECHINGDTISSLSFLPPNQNTLNFAPEAFHRNVVQGTLSFDMKYGDRLWLTKKCGAFLKTFCHDFIYVGNLTQALRKRRLVTDVNRLLAVIQLWPVTKEVKKIEKVWRIIKGKVNKCLKVIRKWTLMFYKTDF